MDESTRLNLSKLVKEYKPEETTQKIRNLKHSDKIKEDIATFVKLKHKYYRLDQNTKKKMYETQCNFLFTNYTNIFNKLIKEQLNHELLYQFVLLLKKIEDGVLDQHEASVQVGQILKEIYIDSALQERNKREEKENKKGNKKGNKKNKITDGKKINWKQWKQQTSPID